MGTKVRKLISVNEEDIQRGERTQAESCPVALALYRELNPGVPILVYGDTIWIGLGLYKAPRSVSRFVKHFDRTGKGKPFRFFITETVV